MTLSDEQLDRYARHIVLKEIGGAGQVRLARATVAVIGAGGIGCPAIQYLAAAGVGRLRVIDDDTVSLSNLQRQILFGTDDLGRPKVEVAGEVVARLNPDAAFEPVGERLTSANAEELIGACDLVLDGCDNFATRLAVADHCTRARIPLVSAALGQFQGQIGTFRGWETDQPCYRCFVGDAFDGDDCDTCAEQGVLGAMAGLIGSWGAMEAVRAIVGFGPDQAGMVHVMDGITPMLRTIRIPKDPGCRTCGSTGS
ncbi:HesA/MoeB/ThiF family protein [Sphingomonas sp. ID1715]|uniref:HesA/MoeB/ThiF family protein n=1 Tax=Sphingomonas sp. ID1715 TaxID=1656898 RepID=UPI00148949E1|nr:HesA/MoeB/ThiF family protein [Sphingomonas sp. ID1715]NNM76010.1 HesA/MoeB/ThiF family protein [Sphingomonas sp. ID1715]